VASGHACLRANHCEGPHMNRSSQPARLNPDSVERLIRVWQTAGDIAARDQVVRSYAPMVKYLATRKVRGLPPHCELDDLVSCGLVALLQAIDKYDASRGTFNTYAWNRVSGAIIDELRRMDWAPRSVRRNARKIAAAREALQRRTGVSPSARQLADELGIPLEELRRHLEAAEGREVISLHASITQQEEGGSVSELGSSLPATPSPSDDPELAALSRERTRVMRNAVTSLSPRERTILFLIYVEELSGAEAGSIVGVTESRVSQILSGIRQKLKRHACRSDAGDLFDLAA
jgi:RNA polymerase sigma factor FliA